MSSALFITSCTTDKEVPPEDVTQGQAGYLVGQITDQKGNGISNATIFIENAVFKNRGAQVSSDPSGHYKVAMVEGLGQWTVKAYVLPKFNGRVYKMFLHPGNTDSFTSEEKPVRNFDWKIKGHTPDMSLNLYYGGSAELYRDLNSGIDDTENVEFTFTPQRQLIDGSTGKILRLTCGKVGMQDHNIINDIPIGRYKVTAIYKPTGDHFQVRDAWHEDEYHDQITIEFLGTESSYRANQMGLGSTDQFQVQLLPAAFSFFLDGRNSLLPYKSVLLAFASILVPSVKTSSILK